MILNLDALAEDGVGGNPSVNSASIVPDLKTFPLHRLDEVEVLETIHLAQHDVTDLQRLGNDWGNRAELA